MRRQVIILASVALMAAVGGYFLSMALVRPPQPARIAPLMPEAVAPDQLVGQRRPGFVLEDHAGSAVSADDLDGQVLLINFWASWCAPCVEEMPLLAELQSDLGERGFRVIGIALDDPQRARDFAAGLAADYTLLYGLAEAAVAGRRFGNDTGLLPYSVLVDATGVVRWTHLGPLTRDLVERQLQDLL